MPSTLKRGTKNIGQLSHGQEKTALLSIKYLLKWFSPHVTWIGQHPLCTLKNKVFCIAQLETKSMKGFVGLQLVQTFRNLKSHQLLMPLDLCATDVTSKYPLVNFHGNGISHVQ